MSPSARRPKGTVRSRPRSWRQAARRQRSAGHGAGRQLGTHTTFSARPHRVPHTGRHIAPSTARGSCQQLPAPGAAMGWEGGRGSGRCRAPKSAPGESEWRTERAPNPARRKTEPHTGTAPKAALGELKLFSRRGQILHWKSSKPCSVGSEPCTGTAPNAAPKEAQTALRKPQIPQGERPNPTPGEPKLCTRRTPNPASGEPKPRTGRAQTPQQGEPKSRTGRTQTTQWETPQGRQRWEASNS